VKNVALRDTHFLQSLDIKNQEAFCRENKPGRRSERYALYT